MKVIPETRRMHTKFDIYIFTAQRVVNVRENRRSNQELTIQKRRQRYAQHVE
jgi:hypothetical protein